MRVGYAVIETDRGEIHSYRADERFAMASTFKALACGAALEAGSAVLDQETTIKKTDLRPYSPVTEKRIGDRLSTQALCEITLSTSDNAAANLILKHWAGRARSPTFCGRSATRRHGSTATSPRSTRQRLATRVTRPRRGR